MSKQDVKYKVTTQQELDELLKINKLESTKVHDDIEIEFSEWWAGCNYWTNQGNHKLEPLGTATSMNPCYSCEKLKECNLKKNTPIWLIENN